MHFLNAPRASWLRPLFMGSFAGATLLTACMADQTQVDNLPTGEAGSDDGAANAAGNSSNTAGTDAIGAGGRPDVGGGSGGKPTAGSNATGGTAAGGTEAETALGGQPAVGGAETHPGVHIGPTCTFHTDAPAAVIPTEAAGGAGSDPPTVTLQTSPLVGPYLADATGRTLYTYGSDLPGDCSTPPQSFCSADCEVSWPIFDAGPRVLAAGLDDAAFGRITRADGTFQTTYFGWPLYYYKSDLVLGQLTGQGKGKTWNIAELRLPTVVIMKGAIGRYLSDGSGHTLYVSAADQVGNLELEPASHCSGPCLDTFEGFRERTLSVVSALEPLDFEVFVGNGPGGLQLAYKGMPLYRAATDLKSGDMNGTAVEGFTAALP